MEMAPFEETVVVCAASPLMDVKASTIGNVTERVPGSDNLFQQFSMNGGITGGGNVRVHGGVQTNNLYLFDGVDSTDPHAGIFMSRERYSRIQENGFKDVLSNPLSTFSIDVDTASYSNIRRYINNGQHPPADAVRIEEMINYFTYDYPLPDGDDAFSVVTELSDCPWNQDHLLLHIGIQGQIVATDDLPACNLVFLLDVSGSMQYPDKLPLVKTAMELLVEQLRPQDRVSIVVYAGAAGEVLPSTAGDRKEEIMRALNSLTAGGSTAGGAGIVLAYKTAEDNFISDGNNRIILATDGDFNVGPSSDDDLVRLIESKRDAGIYLTVLGLGTGNIQDSKMEKIADKGNGNYAYLDSEKEAEKVLVEELSATLLTIAKDVKLQLEFNPVNVEGYRLIGYENRVLAAEDFNDDTKDSGELGAGHCVTALYEIIPAGAMENPPAVDELRYRRTGLSSAAVQNDEIMLLKLRYKKPDEASSRLIEITVDHTVLDLENTTEDFRFSAAVAEFGMILRDSRHRAEASTENVLTLAKGAQGVDYYEYRAEFIELVEKTSRR